MVQLGAELFKTRAEASDAIRALGPAALPLIEAHTTDDPEVAARLSEIRSLYRK